MGNVLRDVVGFTATALEGLDGADNGANAIDIGAMRASLKIAEDIARQYVEAKGPAVACGAAADPVSCIKKEAAGLGLRLFRRKLSADELERYAGIFRAGSKDGNAAGVETLVAAMFLSPHFLYRLDLTKLADPESRTASWLAFALWSSAPDADLLLANERGQLRTRTELQAAARRLWADPRAKRATSTFAEAWIPFAGVGLENRKGDNAKMIPPTTMAFMERETRQFFEAAFWEDDLDFTGLMAGRSGRMNKTLAAHYGLTGPRTDETFEKVMLPPERAGIITQASFLAMTSHPEEASPIARGAFVRQHLLCDELPSPPANVGEIAEAGKGASQRQRFAQHSQAAACAACHKYIDPIGFGLERFDAAGRYVTQLQGHPVTGNGEVRSIADGSVASFTDGRGLAELLSKSPQAERCFVERMFSILTGLTMTPQLQPVVDSVLQGFRGSGRKLAALPALVASHPVSFSGKVEP